MANTFTGVPTEIFTACICRHVWCMYAYCLARGVDACCKCACGLHISMDARFMCTCEHHMRVDACIYGHPMREDASTGLHSITRACLSSSLRFSISSPRSLSNQVSLSPSLFPSYLSWLRCSRMNVGRGCLILSHHGSIQEEMSCSWSHSVMMLPLLVGMAQMQCRKGRDRVIVLIDVETWS